MSFFGFDDYHGVFFRPITDEEKEVFRSYAVGHAEYLFGDNEFTRELGVVNLEEVSKVKESVENNTNYWFKEGYGTWAKSKSNEDGSIYEEVRYVNGIMYLCLDYNCRPMLTDVKRFKPVCTSKFKHRKIINSRRQLRKYLRKEYFKLTEVELEYISNFFREVSNGVIMFI